MPSIFRDNFVDNVFNDMFQLPSMFNEKVEKSKIMNTDVMEYEDRYELAMDLPGFAKEDMTVDLEEGYLTVKASHIESKEDTDNGRFIRKERFSGTCERQFYVGDLLTEEDIKAAFKDGVLKITLPKKEEVPEIEEKKYIAIE